MSDSRLPEALDAEAFFSDLPEITEFSQVTDRRAYVQAPDSWHVVITDVRGSTRAIEEGRYRDVNALGVASIVAICNAAPGVELPYVFGGDGATLLVPERRRAACEAALRGVQQVAQEAFRLELRSAVVPIRELSRESHAVRVARLRISPDACLAMFAGTGLSQAERWVKSTESAARFSVAAAGPSQANFEGFECRWQPVTSRRGAVLSLLVLALAQPEDDKAEIYSDVIRMLEHTLEGAVARPVSTRGLKLAGDCTSEARLRSGADSGERYQAARKHARKQAMIGRVLIGLGATAGGFNGKSYPNELVHNTDFRKFDEMLRMVLDLSESEIESIKRYLEEQRGLGRLVYGMHRAPSALVTCFVRSYAGKHLHFVDGENGGYALAAKELKTQFAKLDASK